MNWVQLGNFDVQGADGTVYWSLDDASDKAGKLWVFLPPFSLARPDENVFIGIANRVSNSERPEFIGQSVAPIANYGQYAKFDIPPVEGLVLGIRGHSSILGMKPRYAFCETCKGQDEAPDDELPAQVLIESILPRVPFLRAIRVPEMKRPTAIHRVGDEYWVFCFSSRAVRFDVNWNFLGEIGPQLARPRPNNEHIDRVWDVAIDQSRDRIYLSCATRHVVRCYRLSTFAEAPELLANIPAAKSGASSWPSSNASRPFEDGYLTFAGGVTVLPDGSVVIASRQGTGGSLEGNFGALLHYSNQGEYIQTLVSRDGNGGLVQDLDYRDWYGKVRGDNGHLWAVSFSQRMLVSWSLHFTDGDLISLQEQYRRLFKPPGLPTVAGWTPYGFAFTSGEIVVTQNANNGVNPGLYKGLYSLSLNDDSLQWFEGQQIELGEQAYGDHPALFSNPHDVLPIGFLGGREVYAVADYGDDKISLIPRPEFTQDFLPYVTVPVLLSEGSEFVGPRDIVLDIASNSAQCPVYRLTPVIPA